MNEREKEVKSLNNGFYIWVSTLNNCIYVWLSVMDAIVLLLCDFGL